MLILLPSFYPTYHKCPNLSDNSQRRTIPLERSNRCRIQQNQEINYNATSPEVLWAQRTPGTTVPRQRPWTWCCTRTRGKTCRIRQSRTDTSRTAIHSNRKRAFGNCLWCWAFPPVHIWSTSHSRVRPQAPGSYSSETTFHCTSPSSEDDDEITSLWRLHYL